MMKMVHLWGPKKSRTTDLAYVCIGAYCIHCRLSMHIYVKHNTSIEL